ncbi:hypothetical protein OVS_03475 [Mycoplasma ovis str. Michigan]|uniref:Uncharacterized protein n=1 Tax=Mycoplasma ovis str. Michigan TaxID=1415773 RepID=A0ABM5P1X4_9MOLU|nr:hypothetical protein [Mycoplasma ovis]AHC40444.1 hypothetical protein OVS_03475 [Mycoplasma ovis str. Michigan]
MSFLNLTKFVTLATYGVIFTASISLPSTSARYKTEQDSSSTELSFYEFATEIASSSSQDELLVCTDRKYYSYNQSSNSLKELKELKIKNDD